jgi:anti-sigma B factor antagonist
MTIEKSVNGSDLKIKVSGRLDTTTAPELEESIKESIEDATSMELDFSDLEYISSAGLRVLLSAQKSINGHGTMVVTGVNDTIMEIFEVTGFSDILDIR